MGGIQESHRCPLCGCGFSATDSETCGGCPMGAHCATLCCPRCGYSFVERSATLGFLHRVAHSTRGWLQRLRLGRG